MLLLVYNTNGDDMTKILIVEDNNDINNLLNDFLKDKYLITQAFAGSEAKRLISDNEYDLILLDLMLPGFSGEELISIIRKDSDIPIIVITAKGDVSTLVDVLALGANDYIAKPFNNSEVLARIEVQLRSHNIGFAPLVYKVGPIEIDDRSHEIRVNDNLLEVTQKEYEILKLFLQYPNQVFTKANIYCQVWKEEYYGDDNTIAVHMFRLRNKLKAVSNQDLIQTVWGIGFKLAI